MHSIKAVVANCPKSGRSKSFNNYLEAVMILYNLMIKIVDGNIVAQKRASNTVHCLKQEVSHLRSTHESLRRL